MSTEEERAKLTDAKNLVFKSLIEQGVYRSCINCESWDEKIEQCTIYNVRPPAQVVVFSCGSGWIDRIPF